MQPQQLRQPNAAALESDVNLTESPGSCGCRHPLSRRWQARVV